MNQNNHTVIARIFPRPCGARKNTTQLAKYPRVLYVKPSNIYIQQHSSCFLYVVRSIVSCGGAYLTIAHTLLQKHSYLWFRAFISLVFYRMVRAGAYWHKIHDNHACAFAVQTKSPLSRLDFFSAALVKAF